MSTGDERVLVYAPTGRDAVLLCQAIERLQVQIECCVNENEFLAALDVGIGAILLTEEGASGSVVLNLARIVEQQPPWSDLPILLLTSSSRSPSAPSAYLLRMAGERGNVTLLERPLRVDTLMSSVKTALRSRRRQYEMRDHLAETQRNEEKMRQTAKLESIGVLAGGIAHDFNNLLTGIIGNASLCLEMNPEPEMEDRLSEVMLAGERAAELTSQLLAYAGKGRFVIRPLDVSALAREIAPLVKRFIPALADLVLRPSSNLPLIDGDRGQLQQVVMNLIINAAESIPQGRAGKIMIRTGVYELGPEDRDRDFAVFEAVPGRYVYLEVSDTGTGMTEEVLGRIFDPFFTTKFQGRGLGLAAVLGIVRGHKGAMRVSSQLGQGTTFTVFFPVSRNAAIEEKSTPPAARAPISATVLFVDDDATVRSVAVSSLEKRGMEVHVAENGRDAIRTLKRFRREISVVILDMSMTDLGGAESLDLLREVRPDIPVILSSGFSEDMLQQQFVGKGLNGFLQKPYTSKQLVEKVSSVLAVVNS